MLESIEKQQVTNYFNFIEKQPAKEIPKFFACSDVALITLAKSEIFAMTIPAKVQSCMACGIPIIVAADGEVQEIIKEAECGLCSNSGDAKALAENILKYGTLSEEIKIQYARNALNYSRKNYKKDVLIERMNKYFELFD